MYNFREIMIPGDVLEDDTISDGAKIMYGKIARLSYKEGYCWASNSFFDGTKSGNTASRQITELKRAGYIRVLGKTTERKIFISPIENRFAPTNNDERKHTSTKNGEALSPKMVATSTKNGEQTAKEQLREQNITTSKKETPDESFTTSCEVVPLKNSDCVKPKKKELTEHQLLLFHAAKECFETSEKAKAIMYQDKSSTSRELAHLKTIAVRCSNMAGELDKDFLLEVLDTFKSMCNGKYKGKMVFTPQNLITPWIWNLVIDSIPAPETKEDERLREIVRGLKI